MPKIAVESEERLQKGKIAQEILQIIDQHPVAVASFKASGLGASLLPRLEERGIGKRRRNSVQVALSRLRRQKFICCIRSSIYSPTPWRPSKTYPRSGLKLK